MEKSKMANRHAPEVRTRAVRMVLEHQGSYETQAAAIAAIAPKIGCIPGTPEAWVWQAERDSGVRDGGTSEERERIKTLDREVRELRQANEILRIGETLSAIGPRSRHWSAIGPRDNGGGERIFCAGGARPPIQAMLSARSAKLAKRSGGPF